MVRPFSPAKLSLYAGTRAALIGLSAALRAPLYVHGPRLRSALEAQVDLEVSRADVDPAVVASLRVANGFVRQLSRTRTSWKNTCLYRSAAQYLVLKDYGRMAAIRIGVKTADHHDDADVAAHSWVLHDGPEPVQDSDTGYEELVLPSRR